MCHPRRSSTGCPDMPASESASVPRRRRGGGRIARDPHSDLQTRLAPVPDLLTIEVLFTLDGCRVTLDGESKSRHLANVVVYECNSGVRPRHDGTTGHPVPRTHDVDTRPVVAESRSIRLHAGHECGIGIAPRHRETP